MVLVCNSKHVKVEAGGFQVPSRLGLYRETLSKDNQKHTIKKGYVCGMCVARINYKKTGFISESVCHFFLVSEIANLHYPHDWLWCHHGNEHLGVARKVFPERFT